MKKNILTTAVLLVLGILFLIPAISKAFTSLDYGWYWIANEAQYDKIEAFQVAGPVTFANTGIMDYGNSLFNAGWNANLISPTYSYAIGPGPTINLNMYFEWNNPIQPFTMDLVYWLNSQSTPSYWGYIQWIGGNAGNDPQFPGWGFYAYDLSDWEDNYNRNPIPEPGTFLLLGTGLLGFGAITKYRRSKKA